MIFSMIHEKLEVFKVLRFVENMKPGAQPE